MSDPSVPPPPSYVPPPPPTGPSGSSTYVSPNRTIMIVLAYLWILVIVPFVAEKEDREVQWHAKHGLVLTGIELILWVAFTILGQIGPLGCLLAIVGPLIWLVFLVLRILCIVKALNGQRFIIPGITQYADRF